MSSEPGILITKPVSVLNKPLNVNFPSLFTALAKAGANTAVVNFGNVPENLVEAGAAIGLSKEPGEIAWVLIFRSLTKAMVNLIKDNEDLLNGTDKIEWQAKEISKERLNKCLSELESTEITIYRNFFDNPISLLIVDKVKEPFSWLLKEFGLYEWQVEPIVNRFPTEFVYALHNEWADNRDKYIILKDSLDSPFIKAAEREQEWRRYSVWLQKQVEERIFSEVFTLKQIYIPLRAYYEQPKNEDEDDNNKYERVVINLEEELQAWLDKAERTDAIRVISGGPGSGKSSFTKMFAALIAKQGKIPVLFISLHLFNPSLDLIDGISKFIKLLADVPLPPNPLEEVNLQQRLLIIFDGLDELALQGKIAEEVAQNFISEVQRQINGLNQSQTRLQVLISGRELIVQKNRSEFRKPKQILHILPYFVKQNERKNYVDTQKLLDEDQRQQWWKTYGKVSNHPEYTSLPEELDQGHLTEVTSQPLLNYLVALSYARNRIKFCKDSNFNEIYADLLSAVYERVWGDNLTNKNPHLSGIKQDDFVRVLEGIATAAWHGGDVRTTTVSDIEKKCDNSLLERVLQTFKQEKKAGITRLLTAFYFRQTGFKGSEETFEFTHKSFGEYLTAKRIVRLVKLIHKKLEAHKNDPDDGCNEQAALKEWAEICGPSAMNKYFFDFLVNEMNLQKKDDVSNWQKTLCHLISFMLRHGMPMEDLKLRNFQEENRQARNAEEALLAVLNSCARVTREISKIKWSSSVTIKSEKKEFGIWISRLHGQRVSFDDDVFCLNCLSFLDLSDCILTFKDFYRANLEGANLTGADLAGAYFPGAYLTRANLADANLRHTYLTDADLTDADLRHTYLADANLTDADLTRANLTDADLTDANLTRADLTDADLTRADLTDASLRHANLRHANLTRANLTDADLTGAKLTGIDRTNVDFTGAKLTEDEP